MVRSAIKKGYILVLAAIIFLLCGCKKIPDSIIDLNKAYGNFEEKKNISSDYRHSENDSLKISQHDVFYSTDHKVRFQMNLDETICVHDMPVVEVKPHYLTEEDAKRIAKVLFGNAPCTEKKPILAEEFSKQEIQKKIARWIQYVDSDALYKLLGEKDTFAQELLKEYIEKFTIKYETAPENEINIPCQWRFKDEAYYTYSPTEIAEKNCLLGNNAIMAVYDIGNISYSYKVVTRNRDDYKLNMISAHLFGGSSPMGIDERIFCSQLCRTNRPTDSQLDAIRDKVEVMLQEMNLGEWYINECIVETTLYGDIPEYIVHLNAVPSFYGANAAKQPELYQLNNKTSYASNYYMTNVTFDFSAEGKLVNFEMISPVEISNTCSENVIMYEINDLIKRARVQLMHSDCHEYGIEKLDDLVKENLIYRVMVNKISLNLLRIRVPNSEDSYYYVPGIILEGTEECVGEKSANVYFSSETPRILVALNAVDGTVIPLVNS